MILEGNERGYGDDLAQHLQNLRQNDHIAIHAVEGFVADDLHGAFAEAEAISQATQCQKYLFSLSLNPPMGATPSIADFEDAVTRAEKRLGLVGQPRAIVFHEKNGRRHAHCVWSRIDGERLRAISLPHYKRKLTALSRELFIEHEWEIPKGLEDAAERDPLNYSREEAGQAKRLKRDPAALKAMFQRCWQASDSRAAFAAALQEEGFLLARGDRRGFVAVDAEGQVLSLSRWCAVKPKALRARLGSEDTLPSVEEVLAEGTQLPMPAKVLPNPKADLPREALVARQRQARADLLAAQEARRIAFAQRPKGLRGAFLRLTGQFAEALKHAEAEARALRIKDRTEQQALIEAHLNERRALAREFNRGGVAAFAQAAADPRQALRLRTDDLSLTRDQLLRDPALILAHVSKTKARFDRTDVLRALAKRIDDPFALRDAADRAMASPQLVRLDINSKFYTTQHYQAAEEALSADAARMCVARGFGVARDRIALAMAAQDAKMHRAFGGRLSAEQRKALSHILGDHQMACVVGLAGAGKSTMLATARDAWARQGVTVHGAALAGKAADGLEEASGIQSRTLASLEASWENGYDPIGAGDVLVVDEAGMIGTRQLARVAAKIDEIGAKLVLVGDPDQLQPIEAGTPFRTLVETHDAARLTEIHRQRTSWQRTASCDLAAGDVTAALDAYAERGNVRHGPVAIEALVESYAMDVAAEGPGTTRLAFAHRRKDVHTLNQAIRAALRPMDDPPPEVLLATETGPRAFSVGDRIVFGRNDRELGIKNGMLGTVEHVSRSRLVVTLDGDQPRKVTLDPRRYTHVDHGYAVTIHKSQGATVDRAYVLASRSMDRHLAYVAMTRHREALNVYVRPNDAPVWTRSQHHRTRDRPHDVTSRSGPSMG